jgi:hypothetical protein
VIEGHCAEGGRFVSSCGGMSSSPAGLTRFASAGRSLSGVDSRSTSFSESSETLTVLGKEFSQQSLARRRWRRIVFSVELFHLPTKRHFQRGVRRTAVKAEEK